GRRAPEGERDPSGWGAGGRPAAPDLHPDSDRPYFLRDHPAQGRRGIRRGQLSRLVRIHRTGPDRPRRAGAAQIGEGRMSHRWTGLPQRAGETSRQAHADLPAGSFERELGKEGFFGPATHMYHRHPPTGWTGWEGPLKPRAFDLNKLGGAVVSPWEAPLV